MKNLKETIERRIKEKGITKELIYSSIGMTKAGFDSALKKESLKLKEFSIVANLLTIEPNYFFEWTHPYTGKNIGEPDAPYNTAKNDTKGDTIPEAEFLRGQIVVLNNQIDDLIKTIKNFSERN